MNLLANLSPSYRQSLDAKDVAGIRQFTDVGNRPVSVFAEGMRVLQQLKENDPTLYQRVALEIIASLQRASQTTDEALDIRQLLARRQPGRLRSSARHLNRLAYCLLLFTYEPLALRRLWQRFSSILDSPKATIERRVSFNSFMQSWKQKVAAPISPDSR